MNKQVELEKHNLEEESIISSSDLLLTELDINLSKIKSIKPHWKRTQYRAVVNWISKYKLPDNPSNLDYVKDLLESFHHFCELEDWQRASLTISISLNLPTKEELQEQLGIWGYYQEQINFFKKLLGKLNSSVDSVCLNGFGNAYHSLGDYERSLDCHQQNLEITRDIGDRSGEGNALGGLGNVYNSQGKYSLAMDYYQQWLNIARETGDRRSEGSALGGLGRAYEALENYSLALDRYQRWLKLAREVGDRDGESRALENFGSVYYSLEDYHQAINYSEQSLVIIREIANRNAEIRILLGLGSFYYYLNEYSQGIGYYQEALNMIRVDNRDRDSLKETRLEEAEALEYLGVGYGNLEQYPQAISYFEQYLEIVRETGDLVAQGIALQNLSFAYKFLGDEKRAVDSLRESLMIAIEICNSCPKEDLESEELEYLSRVLTVCREIGDFETESTIISILNKD